MCTDVRAKSESKTACLCDEAELKSGRCVCATVWMCVLDTGAGLPVSGWSVCDHVDVRVRLACARALTRAALRQSAEGKIDSWADGRPRRLPASSRIFTVVY